MELFINHVPPKKFRQTNQIWNHLRLNAPWSIGYVSYLISTKVFKHKQQWEQFYYQTGQQRNSLLKNQAKAQSTVKIVNDGLLSYKYPKAMANIPNKFKNLNFYYGRTQKQLEKKGKILRKYAEKSGFILPLQESIACVKFRVIGETWNGIIGREKNVQTCLEHFFKKAVFRKTTAEFDHKYAVDIELYYKDKRICGLQVKPVSYLSNAPYLQTAHKANQRKNEAYFEHFGVTVLTIIAKVSGQIMNQEVLEQMKTLLKQR